MINPAQSCANLLKGTNGPFFDRLVALGRVDESFEFARFHPGNVDFLKHEYLLTGCINTTSIGDAGSPSQAPRTVITLSAGTLPPIVQRRAREAAPATLRQIPTPERNSFDGSTVS